VAGEWRIPAERMKGRRGRKRPHTVYLSPQAQEVVDVARALAPAGAVYVFPSEQYGRQRHVPFGRSSLAERMTRTCGKRVHVAHGWRASFSTILNVTFPADRQVIDAMLAHQTKGAVEQRYNRTTELTYRARASALWCEWAAMLLDGAPSAWSLAGLPVRPAPNVIALADRRAA
jgi:integrase